jgi:hypothetical protein
VVFFAGALRAGAFLAAVFFAAVFFVAATVLPSGVLLPVGVEVRLAHRAGG